MSCKMTGASWGVRAGEEWGTRRKQGIWSCRWQRRVCTHVHTHVCVSSLGTPGGSHSKVSLHLAPWFKDFPFPFPVPWALDSPQHQGWMPLWAWISVLTEVQLPLVQSRAPTGRGRQRRARFSPVVYAKRTLEVSGLKVCVCARAHSRVMVEGQKQFLDFTGIIYVHTQTHTL